MVSAFRFSLFAFIFHFFLFIVLLKYRHFWYTIIIIFIQFYVTQKTTIGQGCWRVEEVNTYLLISNFITISRVCSISKMLLKYKRQCPISRSHNKRNDWDQPCDIHKTRAHIVILDQTNSRSTSNFLFWFPFSWKSHFRFCPLCGKPQKPNVKTVTFFIHTFDSSFQHLQIKTHDF